ncbi:MAG: hypothetical protein FJ147_13745 [Deltaproteobacteria bacterium]|nr:hypothetical protein [Deltaproteobacteria bacterium]
MSESKFAESVELVWATTGRAYIEAMDELLPFLTIAEQVVYHRLFRLSHAEGVSFTRCRYSELATQCGVSMSTLQRALRGLRAKKLIKTIWQSHGASTFHIQLLSTLTARPAFLPRKGQEQATKTGGLRTPPLYVAFTPEDRDLFLACKRSLSPQTLNRITEQAVEWLTERAGGNPEVFSDEALRDKVDELVVREVFGPERLERYADVLRRVERYENEE